MFNKVPDILGGVYDGSMQQIETGITATKSSPVFTQAGDGCQYTVWVQATKFNGADTTLRVKFEHSEDGVTFKEFMSVPIDGVGVMPALPWCPKGFMRMTYEVGGAAPDVDLFIRIR